MLRDGHDSTHVGLRGEGSCPQQGGASSARAPPRPRGLRTPRLVLGSWRMRNTILLSTSCLPEALPAPSRRTTLPWRPLLAREVFTMTDRRTSKQRWACSQRLPRVSRAARRESERRRLGREAQTGLQVTSRGGQGPVQTRRIVIEIQIQCFLLHLRTEI